MVLDDLKAFILEKGIVPDESIKFDFDGGLGENVIVFWNNGSVPCDLARRSTIQVTVKNSDLDASRLICEEIYKAFYPEELYQKSMSINGKTMHINSLKDPYFLEKDSSGRHCYVFNIVVTHS